jgi:ABC-type uncharacterized transport system involved in gliding motility auxiliary subunit
MARSPEATDSIQRTTRRRWSLGLNAAAAVTLAALLVAMLNYLAQRNYARADWSRTRFYSLSDKTTHLLASLSNRVDITMFFQTDHPFYEDVANLLQEYTYQSPLLRVEKVDPNRNLARTEELSRRYQVTELNVVVFDHHGRSKVVRADDLMEMDYSGLAGGEPPRASAFKGEQVFSSALQSIAQERPPKVYFLGGHGERDINDRDPYAGYSELARRVRGDNAEAIDFTLAAQHGVPADADAVVISGPTKPLAAQEIETLQAWVEKKNGRLMVLLDTGPSGGLETLLAAWGVRLDNDVVLDPKRTLTGLDLFVDAYGPHPITRRLQQITSVFYMPRSVESSHPPLGQVDRADQPVVSTLAFSSAESWAESDLEQKPMKFEARSDRRGPISLAVAVERGPLSLPEVEIRPTRMVVFGDTDFLSNGAMSGGNADLFMSALNWLLDREQLMAIAPKPLHESRLVMTRGQVTRLFWVVTFLLPGLVGVLGLAVWMQRRS